MCYNNNNNNNQYQTARESHSGKKKKEFTWIDFFLQNQDCARIFLRKVKESINMYNVYCIYCVAKFVLPLLSNASRSLHPDRPNNSVLKKKEYMLYHVQAPKTAFEFRLGNVFIASRATYAFCRPFFDLI